MDNKLKPCPFCGSADVGIGHLMPRFGEEVTFMVICNRCRSRTANFRSKEGAIAIWNSWGNIHDNPELIGE